MRVARTSAQPIRQLHCRTDLDALTHSDSTLFRMPGGLLGLYISASSPHAIWIGISGM